LEAERKAHEQTYKEFQDARGAAADINTKFAAASERAARLVEVINEVTAATSDYLPPDEIDAQECLSRILAATDNAEVVKLLGEVE